MPHRHLPKSLLYVNSSLEQSDRDNTCRESVHCMNPMNIGEETYA
jgi:hypothetical protein